MINNKHLIGTLGNNEAKKLIVVGGMHGNEKSGVEAILETLDFFAQHPEIKLNGKIYFLQGNIGALKKGERFIDKDLNRLWHEDYIQNEHPDIADVKEVKELHKLISEDICQHNYSNCTLLDLHTFSAKTGAFCIPAENKQSVALAQTFKTPFVEKLVGSLPETALNYFGNKGMTAVVFEGGTHASDEARTNLKSSIFHTIAYLDLVNREDFDIVFEMRKELYEISKNLPHYLRLTYIHKLNKYNNYQTKPGYFNFKKINKGEVIATQDGKQITSPSEGYILMPLYQKKGSDGFFIVQEFEL